VAEAETAYLQLYEHHAALMRFINSLGTPMPREFTAAVEYAINSLLRRACASDNLDGERIRNLLREAQASTISLDKTTLEFTLRRKIEGLAARFANDPFDLGKLDDLKNALRIVKLTPFSVNLWSPQNHVYATKNQFYRFTSNKAKAGDSKAQEWMKNFSQLCELLMIRVE
jgi:hypothetical protein